MAGSHVLALWASDGGQNQDYDGCGMMSDLPKPMTADDIAALAREHWLDFADFPRVLAREAWRRDMEAVRDWLRENDWLSLHSDPHYYDIGRAFADQIEAALKEAT